MSYSGIHRAAIKYKPSTGYKVNLRHPQLSGCIHFWPLNEGGGSTAYDVISDNNATISGSYSWLSYFNDKIGRPVGPSPYFSTNDDGNKIAFDRALTLSGDRTIVWQNHIRVLTSNGGIWGDLAGTSELMMRSFSSYQSTRFIDDAGANDTPSPTYPQNPANGDTWTMAVVVRAGNGEIYSDQYEGNKATGGTLGASTISAFSHGAGFSSSAGCCSTFWARIYDRALMHAEIMDIFADPWGPFMRPLPIWVSAGAGPTGWQGIMNEISTPTAINEQARTSITSVNEVT